jgi:epoxyqueuosine reductase
VQSLESDFFPLEADRAAPRLADLLTLSEAGFRQRFAGSAVERAGRDQMARNACLAAANGGQVELAPLVERLLGDASAVVRGHAAYALARLRGAGAGPALRAALERETEAEAAEEMRAALLVGNGIFAYT